MVNDYNQSTPEGQIPHEALPVPQAGSTGVSGYPQHLPTYEFSPQAQGSGLSDYWHALRRRWWLALGIGLLFAGIAAPAAWVTQTPRYSASALLRVSPKEKSLVFDTSRTSGPDFSLYKNTQSQLVKSDFVLNAALRDQAAAALPEIKEQEDPIRWLSEEIRVDFPGDGELMRVSMSGDSAHAVATLVNSVVDAYLREVVDKEEEQQRKRKDELDTVYAEKETQIRGLRSDLANITKLLETNDSGALSVKQQFTMEHLSELRNELSRAGRELYRMQSEFDAKQRWLATFDRRGEPAKAVSQAEPNQPAATGSATAPAPSPPTTEQSALQTELNPLPIESAPQPAEAVPPPRFEVDPIEIDALVRADPISNQLSQQRDDLRAKLAAIEQTVRPPHAAQYTKKYQAELDVVEGQLATRRKGLADEQELRRRRALEAEIAELGLRIEIATDLTQQLQKYVDEAEKNMKDIGGSSLDVEMQRGELSHQQESFNAIAKIREQLSVELKWGSSNRRVELFQRAFVPRIPDKTKRIQLTALAGLAGLMLPLVLFVLLDVRAKRVNCSEQISEGMGLMVLGTVPVIPVRAIQHGGTLSRRHQHWRALLNEAINNVIIRLLREAREGPLQVLLVTSATSGEGKTTLATQMAMSLARSGRRTLLVDCDLRRPALDRVFHVSQQPGMAELLLGELELADVEHETTVDNLYLVTAGGWLQEGLEVLTSGAMETVLTKFRTEYDFIVLDGSPVLPVPDARIIAQHVDAVVLSVLRDVTQVPKLRATWRILTALGVRAIGSVVTGTSEEVYYKDMYYTSRVPA